jgi:hypothetical protein
MHGWGFLLRTRVRVLAPGEESECDGVTKGGQACRVLRIGENGRLSRDGPISPNRRPAAAIELTPVSEPSRFNLTPKEFESIRQVVPAS